MTGLTSSDTIFYIGVEKFFYLRWGTINNVPVESGQLDLYVVGLKSYLLRERFWLVENSENKLLYKHSGNYDVLIDESIVSTAPVWYDDDNKKRRKQTKIRVGN